MNDDELLPNTNATTQKRSSRAPSSSNEILKTYQVDAYKFVNKKYENRGKVGLALLGSKISNHFNMLIYGKGNSHITQANIHSEFSITSTEELCVSFYDIKSENWSLRFDSNDMFTDFMSRICIYKMMSSNKTDLVIIDIKSGSGPKVQENDLCEIELTINPIRNNDVAPVLYSSENQETLRTQIGSNKFMMAIEKGLVGMSRGGFRVIGVSNKSPFFKGGSIMVSAETNILIYIKLVRSKSKLEKPNIKSDVTADVDIPLPDLNFDKPFNSELESSDKSKKSDLLSRMAILGRPILAYNAESSNESPVKNIVHTTSNPTTSHDPNFSHPTMPISYNNLYDPTVLSKQILPVHSINPPYSTIQQIYPPVNTSQSASTDFSVLFTETRQNNTEMRVAMSKLQDKIDKILEKIDTKASNSTTTLTRHMDAENVFENIKRIINENESLKIENTQKSEIIDKQNKRINEMLKNNQWFLDESHDVIQRNSASFNSSSAEQQSRILQLEEDKLNLIRNLSQKTAEVSSMEQKLEDANNQAQSYRVRSLEFNDQISKLSEEIGDLKLKNRSLVTEVQELKSIQNSESKMRDELETRQKQWLEQEIVFQSKTDAMKNKIVQLNSKINEIQSNCEQEIAEVQQKCHQEVEDWKNKLKAERQRINNKNSDLMTEIDQINHDWERRFDEYRQTESAKSAKISERNRELMIENSNLQRDLIQSTQQLAISGDVQSTRENQLQQSNDSLSRQLAESRNKLEELADAKLTNLTLQAEMLKLSENIGEMQEQLIDYQLVKKDNVDLHHQLQQLQLERDELIAGKGQEPTTPDMEVKIKKIMNDIFKEIKSDFELETNYSGKEVLNICMTIIRDMTLVHIGGQSTNRTDDNDDNSNDSDDDDDSDNESTKFQERRQSDINNIDIDHAIIEQATINITDPHESRIDANIEEVIQSIDIVPDSNSDVVTSDLKLSLDKLELNTDEIADKPTESVIDHENQNQIDVLQIEQDNQLIIENQSPHQIETEAVETHPVNSLPLETDHVESEDVNEPHPILLQSEHNSTELLQDQPIDEPIEKVYTESDPLKTTSTKAIESISLSSDEDDDVLEFFEKLTQKTKPQNSTQLKPEKPNVVSSDNDDLSWLND